VIRRISASLGLAILLLTACRSAAVPQASTAAILPLDEPCALLSRQDIQTVTGSPVTRVHHPISKKTGKPMKDTCSYEADRPYGAIIVWLDRSGERDFHRHVEELARDPHQVVEVVPGLGDEAYLIGRTELMVLRSGEVTTVGSQYYAPDGAAILIRLAGLALDGL
jgi:hypothetical protein